MKYILAFKVQNGDQYTGLDFATREIKNIKSLLASSLVSDFNVELDLPENVDRIFAFNLINPDMSELSEFFYTPEEYVESRKNRRFKYYCIGYTKNNESKVAIIDVKYKRVMFKNFGKHPEIQLTVGPWL